MLWDAESGPVAMGCKCVAKWQYFLCKDYYRMEKEKYFEFE